MASGTDVLTCAAVGLAAIAATMSFSHAVNTRQRLQAWLLTLSAVEYAASAGAVAESPVHSEHPALPRMPDDDHSGGHSRTAHRITPLGQHG